MGTYGLEKVIALWEAEKLTSERAIGQILLLLQIIETRLDELQGRADSQRARKAAGKVGEIPLCEE